MSQSLLFYRHVDFAQLKKRAKELLKAYRAGDGTAAQLFDNHYGAPITPETAKLADAQLVLARDFDYPSWPRFKLAAEFINLMRADDAVGVLRVIAQHPKLLGECVFGEGSNWGPPLAVAAQLNTPNVFETLMTLEGQDMDFALARAILQGNTGRARKLYAAGARPPRGEIMGPCESLNVEGMRFLIECGEAFEDDKGDPLAPLALLLEGYHRNPAGKHACLEYCAEIGIDLPDTPMMAFHRGRIDLLERHLKEDVNLIHRRFSHREIYPPSLGCHGDESLALHGTPIAGTTLLHMAMDFNEVTIARWLLEKGVDVNARADLDSDGFGGHTSLFNLAVSQSNLVGTQSDGILVNLLLECGADPNMRASIRKGIRFIGDETIYEYRDMTALEYARSFRHKRWVNEDVCQVLEKLR